MATGKDEHKQEKFNEESNDVMHYLKHTLKGNEQAFQTLNNNFLNNKENLRIFFDNKKYKDTRANFFELIKQQADSNNKYAQNLLGFCVECQYAFKIDPLSASKIDPPLTKIHKIV